MGSKKDKQTEAAGEAGWKNNSVGYRHLDEVKSLSRIIATSLGTVPTPRCELEVGTYRTEGLRQTSYPTALTYITTTITCFPA
jgi:hypothetical protein